MPPWVIIGSKNTGLGVVSFVATFLIVRWAVTHVVAAPDRSTLQASLNSTIETGASLGKVSPHTENKSAIRRHAFLHLRRRRVR